MTSKELSNLENRIKVIENRFGNMAYDMRGVVQSELKDNFTTPSQAETQFGLYFGLVIETIDVWKQNRIRWFSPLFHDPKRPIKELPWAYPISAMGGFDDCGLSWVPPAGSTVGILFEGGSRSSPYYIGTVWHRNRGPEGKHNWNCNVEEYYKIWEGHRKGYLVGPNDESQVLPPWNTESYNGFDLSSIVDFAENPEAQRRITYPNIYGFKTPEKHMVKMVDGDPKCNRKWKRMEIQSSCGNWIILKDDHLHYGGQWAHPASGLPDADVSCVEGVSEGSASEDIARFQGLNPGGTFDSTEDLQSEANRVDSGFSAITTDTTPKEGKKKEEAPCEGDSSNSKIIGGHPSTGHPLSKYFESQKGANPYFKHENELRPYKGPQTPQNNKCFLPQTGMQFLSISGHTLVMDDSVEEPSGEPLWERSTKPFDFGCNDHYVGRMFMVSATGQTLELSDIEEPAGTEGTSLRGEHNGIFLTTATGISLGMSDHTITAPSCAGCPPNVAGERRGITMRTSSMHTFEMIDHLNEQCSPCRKNGGVPVAKAKNAYINLRSGYGLQFSMEDFYSQEETQQQAIKILCPQKDNTDRGPHIMHFQEAPSGPGLIFLRAGGNYVLSTYDDCLEIIGDIEKKPSNKIEIITKQKMVYSKDFYINYTEESQVIFAKKNILLLAGQDCDEEGGCPGDSPCPMPVVVYDPYNNALRISDRIIGSSSLDAPCASITMLSPLTPCPPCSG